MYNPVDCRWTTNLTTLMVPVAAFDFDGTLTRRDTFVPFLRRVAGTRALLVAMAAEVPAVARRDRNGVKAGVVRRLFAGRRVAEVTAMGERFADDIVARRLRADTVTTLRWHQHEGHRTVIVSASLRAYLAPVAADLGIDHVICTELEERDGVFTGELVDGNCRGLAKADRLQSWIGADRGELWAYGDSSGDDELLALAAHKVRVR
jgi:phosphatidylglycerophosphatase C